MSFALLSVAPGAHANGRYPRAQEIVVGPGTPPAHIAVRTTFGIVVSDDGGRTFQFLCEEALQYLDGQDPSIALGTDGALLAGEQDGLVAMYDRCVGHRVTTFDAQTVIDLATDPRGQLVFGAVNATEGTQPVARVARSADGGRTFRVTSARLAGMALDTVEVAASDPQRVYATAHDTGHGPLRFYRSTDGGETLTATAASLAGVDRAYIAGVDPTNPDRVYVRAQFVAAGGADAASESTALLLSTDGGETFAEVARTQSPMYGFAISDDGGRVWIGGSDATHDGLQRSDDGGPFRQIRASSVQCLRYRAGVLYECEYFQPDGTMVSVSRDDGATFARLVGFGDIQAPPSCPASTTVGSICPLRWSGVRSVIAPGAQVGGDASVRDDAGGGGPGPCGCRAVGAARRARGAGEGAVVVMVWMIGVWRGRRRRAISSAPP